MPLLLQENCRYWLGCPLDPAIGNLNFKPYRIVFVDLKSISAQHGVLQGGVRHDRITHRFLNIVNLLYASCTRLSNNVLVGKYSIYSPSRLIRHARDTVYLFNLQGPSHLRRHAWDTVDLFNLPGPSHLRRHACMGYSGPIQSPGP